MNRTAREKGALLVFLSLALFFAVGCSRQEEKQSGIVQYYLLKGQVVDLKPSSNRITIAHEWRIR